MQLRVFSRHHSRVEARGDFARPRPDQPDYLRRPSTSAPSCRNSVGSAASKLSTASRYGDFFQMVEPQIIPNSSVFYGDSNGFGSDFKTYPFRPVKVDSSRAAMLKFIAFQRCFHSFWNPAHTYHKEVVIGGSGF